MNRRAVVLLGALLLPGALHAQGTESMTLSATTVSFPTPTITDFDNGFLTASTTVTYTVATSGGPKGASHTATVSIKSSSANLGGTKALSDLQWSRADLGTWNSMTTTNATVEQRTIVRGGANDPWSNSVNFQMLLSYANDAPGAHSAALVFTLTITTP